MLNTTVCFECIEAFLRWFINDINAMTLLFVQFIITHQINGSRSIQLDGLIWVNFINITHVLNVQSLSKEHYFAEKWF